ncbi:hypothetical protein Tco_0269561 [Tanacetum coccineum]
MEETRNPKKVQRTLLKQQYENFAASSSESLDQTFDRLQKLINQLEIQGHSSKVKSSKCLLCDPPKAQSTKAVLRSRSHAYGVCMLISQELQRIIENIGREFYGRKMPVENPTENALIAQDGFGGYDWSYQDEEEHHTNYALMALTSSGSSSSSNSESQFNLVSYKVGLQSVEERLVHYKKNEAVFADKINILNLEVKLRDNALVEYTKKLEKAEKERDELKLTLEKYQNSSKSLNTLLESQVSDKVKTGLGYKAASPTEESFVISFEMLENQEKTPKPDLMFINEQVESESVDVVSNVSSTAVKTVELKVEFVDSGKLKTASTPVNTVRPVNTADSKQIVNYSRPISNAFKRGYSQAIRPFNKYSAYKKTIFNKEVNAVKASACWVWKAKHNSASNTFKKYSYIDAQGRSKSIMAWIPKRV